MADTNIFKLNTKGYFTKYNADFMAFSDFYPSGHQSGITLVMNDRRILSNGDIRFEHTPGQWQPLPKQLERKTSDKNNTVTTCLKYPDEDQMLKGFNPLLYPDLDLEYTVRAEGKEDGLEVTVDLDRPIPEKYYGKLCFNMELFPGAMFGKSWIIDSKTGVFPRQPNGPVLENGSNYDLSRKILPKSDILADKEVLAGKRRMFDTAVKRSDDTCYDMYNPLRADEIIAEPYAAGYSVTVCPEDSTMCFNVISFKEKIGLYDGRMNHNNGWFVLSCNVPLNTTKDAIKLFIKPVLDPDWVRKPVIQVSQVGYHPKESKKAVIEISLNDKDKHEVILERLSSDGVEKMSISKPHCWGKFLRYKYLTFDFSQIEEEGIYRIRYGKQVSNIFRIAEDIYERGVWQPVLEYFLPVQMCHMRVNEKYRVWHGCCHMDDARMAPVNYNHFDGALQGASTLTKFKPGEHIPGVNCGGWHDAGDFDLRIESQTAEVYNLSMAYEEFGVYIDETTIDQERHITEIHRPDGKNDILQQIEHGALSIIGGYKALGRLYKQIICGDLRQYVLLGDAVNMTEGTEDNPTERLLFTEDNPAKELTTAAHLAAASRALMGFNDKLSKECLETAKQLYDITGNKPSDMVSLDYEMENMKNERTLGARVHAASELLITTGEEKYRDFLHRNMSFIRKNIKWVGWFICRSIDLLDPIDYDSIKIEMIHLREEMDKMSAETPYGIPYKPGIWGAGWAIQGMGSQYYFLHKTFPDIFGPELMYNALQFILGCHPGENTESFASGVGVKSATVAYGANRADWSYIPGGVVSGTALIRPDLPELLEFPFLWQQKEYVIGGGSSNYLMLVLAVRNEFKK